MQVAAGESTRGLLAAGGAFVLWGLLPLYWKSLQHVPPFEILCHRIVWSVVFIALLTSFQGSWGEVLAAALTPRVLALSALSGSVIGLNWLLYIWAVNSGRILGTSLGYYMNPLVNVLLGAVFFAERLRRWQAVAIGLAAAGVVNLTVGYGSFPWVALALAVSFALYGALRKVARVGSITGLALETALLAGPALGYLVWAGARGSGAFGRGGLGTAALLAGAGVATSLPLVGFAYGVRRLRLTTVGLLQYLAPSIAFVLGVFVYREPFSRSHLATFACIWGALALYTAEGLGKAWRRPAAPGTPRGGAQGAEPPSRPPGLTAPPGAPFGGTP